MSVIFKCLLLFNCIKSKVTNILDTVMVVVTQESCVLCRRLHDRHDGDANVKMLAS